ncbi:MAG: ATP synthase F1 subunit gamma [Chloroflexi bacterium]|nr:ATP synthase F1 subunit gamma [Chloroflexota bacterium]
MATAREVKKRIRSVKNISQITRALEAVSASRVRKAQARVLASRAFAEKAWEILLNLQRTAAAGGPALHPLLAARDDVKQVMVVLITSDRGLAGAFNSNIIRVAQRFSMRVGKPVRYVTVGRKGRDTLVRMGANVIAEFSDLSSEPRMSDISPIARLAIDEFLGGTVDDVFIAYTDFINMLTQRPVVLRWLPLMPYHPDDRVMAELVKDVPQVSQTSSDYEYEPSAAAILEEIVPRFTELQLYQAVLESQASEHAARMVAMRNASDNATQLTADLTLVYNKARQAAITAEILDIVGGANALQTSIDELATEILKAAPVSEPIIYDGFARTEEEVNPPATKDEPVLGQPQAGEVVTPPASLQDEVEAVKPVTEQPGKPDDLTIIEGIGRKMATALKAAGIDTFDKLAQATEAQLVAAIEAAGMRFAPSLPTWPQQAAYALRGDWDGLKAFQKQLTSGRKTP